MPSAAKIVNADGDDVTASYEITYVNGELEVTKKAVTITADSDSKVYDGTALTKDSYTNTALAEGDTIKSVTVTGSQTIVGKSDNVPSAAKIVNADGVDVTASYEITYANGTLEVTKRSLTLTSATATKAYDGTALTDDTITVTGDGFAEGEGAAYDVTGAQILVGSSENTFTYTLKEGTLADNYEITTAFGTLTVTGDSVEPEKTTETVETPYALGDKIPFTIAVHNVSDAVVEKVTVIDETAEIIAGEGYTVVDEHTAEITGLQPDATVNVTALHEVTDTDILAGEYVNTATVRMPDGTELEVTGSTEQIGEVDATLTVTNTVTNAHEDGTAFGLDETIEYEVTVTNDGNVPMTNITVTDETTGLNETIDVLQPGETVTFAPSHTVTEEDIAAGEVVSTVKAEADEIAKPDGTTVRPAAEASVTAPVRSEYTLTIQYRYQDGRQARPDYTATVAYGTDYDVASPAIKGYHANQEKVTGTMPARDVTVTVIYTADPVPAEAPEAPTGVGAGGLNVGESIE